MTLPKTNRSIFTFKTKFKLLILEIPNQFQLTTTPQEYLGPMNSIDFTREILLVFNIHFFQIFYMHFLSTDHIGRKLLAAHDVTIPPHENRVRRQLG
jgi:hypothetical protein